MNNIEERLREIRNEDFIWIIYIGIIMLSYYSNYLEEKYFKNNDLNSKEKYRTINIIIFSILLLVYLYFLIDSYNGIKSLNEKTDDKVKFMTYLSFIASLLIVIAGIIYLYIALNDENIAIEQAFN